VQSCLCDVIKERFTASQVGDAVSTCVISGDWRAAAGRVQGKHFAEPQAESYRKRKRIPNRINNMVFLIYMRMNLFDSLRLVSWGLKFICKDCTTKPSWLKSIGIWKHTFNFCQGKDGAYLLQCVLCCKVTGNDSQKLANFISQHMSPQFITTGQKLFSASIIIV